MTDSIRGIIYDDYRYDYDDVDDLSAEFMEAVMEGELEEVEAMLWDHAHGAFSLDINRRGPSLGFAPLHWASFKGLTEMAELLMMHGANANVTNNMRGTPLHDASSRRHFETAELLVSYGGADVHFIDNKGDTALHNACQAPPAVGRSSLVDPKLDDHVRTVIVLVSNGANVNARNLRGETPVGLACENGFDMVAGLLMTHGADPQVKNHQGETPLSLACKNGHVGAIKLLIQFGGATVHSQGNKNVGESPLYWAAEGNHPDLVWFLVRQYPMLATKL